MKHYAGKKAETYDRDRQNDPKWIFEEATLRAFFTSATGIKSIIDAPVGTGRFLPMFSPTHTVGYDCSEDMLKQAMKHGKAAKLELHDIVAAPLPTRADLVVSFRFLNLIDACAAQQALEHLLAAAKKYIVFTCRVDEQSIKLGRVTVHPNSLVSDTLESAGFEIVESHVYPDSVPGRYTVFIAKRLSARKRKAQEQDDTDHQPDHDPTTD
jgi:SAM-dependent methyltransferase